MSPQQMTTQFSAISLARWAMGLLAIGLLLASCSSSPYERLLESELASGARYDSLFLGMYLGMPAQDFYQHCWELNRDSLIRQGPSNLSVQYTIDSFRYQTYMRFYPRFTEDSLHRIYEMPLLFEYETWTPWQPETHSDQLVPEVLELFNEWYGGEFLTLNHPEKGEAYVKINGNRRVIVSTKSNRYVQAVIRDMLAEAPQQSSPNEQNPE